MKQFVYALNKGFQDNIKAYFNTIDKYAIYSPFTMVYGLARSFLAASLLVTLLFNKIDYLYADFMFAKAKNTSAFFNDYNLFFLFNYEHLWIAQLISILVLILVIIGYFPQVTALLHWWVSYSFFNSALLIEGGDQIFTIITLLLIPVALLDTRINHWHSIKKTSVFRNLTAWIFFILIEIQAAFLYLQAGIEKPYKVEEWRDGSAIYYWFSHNIFGANSFIFKLLSPLLGNQILIFLINWGVIIFELTLFGVLFMKPKNRIGLFFCAVAFHLFIVLIHGLTSFFISITGLLIIYMLNQYIVFYLNDN